MINKLKMLVCTAVMLVVFSVLSFSPLVTNNLKKIKPRLAHNYSLNKSFTMDSKELYDATNTHDYLYDHTTLDTDLNKCTKFDNNARYNLTVRNNNKIYSSAGPLMTVFTHGLGGGANNWSNDGKENFAYTTESLITKLFKESDSNVYWVKVGSNGPFFNLTKLHIYDMTCLMKDCVANNKEGYSFTDEINNKNKYEIAHITDISKHSIIVFEGSMNNSNNDQLYTQFNYAISKIVYDIACVNNGVLPKINLIGHSRGGLTNLQYAMDHPDLVASMYSFGTPYCSSTSAVLDATVLKALGLRVSNADGGEDDIINTEIVNKYMNRWNNNYNTLYRNIHVMALGGYAGWDFVMSFLLTQHSLNAMKELVKKFGISDDGKALSIATAINATLSAGFSLLYAVQVENALTFGITKEVIKIGSKIILSSLIDLCKSLAIIQNYNMITQAATSITDMLFSELNYDFSPPFVSFYNDGLVNLASQLGYMGGEFVHSSGYQGFIRKTKCFHFFEVNEKESTNNFSVIHNIEASDQTLTNYVANEIQLTHKTALDYAIYNVSPTEIGLSAYYGSVTRGTLVLPNTIDGKTVSEIGENAFAENFYDRDITKVVIPASVKVIGKGAFQNCTKLTNIIWENNANTEEIKEGAFLGCTSLENIDLPKKLKIISDDVFKDTAIKSLFIPASVTSISEKAFFGSQVKKIVLQQDNKFYKIEDNTLYDFDETVLIFSPNVTELTLPKTVKKINQYAFANNTSLTQIDLAQTEYIGDYAFVNCTALQTVLGGDNVMWANKAAFLNTKWLNSTNNSQNNNDTTDAAKTIGHALLLYNGNDTKYTIKDNIKYVGEFAFCSEKLEEVTIGNVNTLAQYAFSECNNLKDVIMYSVYPPTVYNTLLKN